MSEILGLANLSYTSFKENFSDSPSLGKRLTSVLLVFVLSFYRTLSG